MARLPIIHRLCSHVNQKLSIVFGLASRRSLGNALVLSFRADGPFWSDLVHVLAYPDEISYVWPFRYDAGRIEPALRKELSDLHSRRGLAGSRVLIAARFHTAAASAHLLPLRWARII